MSNKKTTTENDNSLLLNNKIKRDQEVNDEYASQKKMKASFQIPSNLSKEDNNINFNESLDEVLSKRKQEAVEQYIQYKSTIQFEHLNEALAKDNTNSDILYEYLNYLSKRNPTEFDIQYKWRCLFLKREHMIALKADDLYAKDTIKNIFIKIFEQLNLYSDTEDWLQKTKDLIKQYQINNPYCLKLLNNSFLFTTSRTKELDNIPELQIKTIDDLRPNCPLSLTDKFIAYKELITELSLYVNDIVNPSFLYDLLKVIRETLKTIPSHLEVFDSISRILVSDKFLSLPYSLKYHLDKYKINLELISLDQFYEREISIIDSYNPYIEKISSILTRFIKDIYNSKTMLSALENLFKTSDYLPLINENFIDKALSQMNLFGFLNYSDFGITDEPTNQISINTQERKLFEDPSFGGNLLFNVFGFAVTIIHEVFGHYAKRYIYYYTNREMDNKTDRSLEEGGDYLEYLLFDEKDAFNFEKIMFFFDKSNWNKDVTAFSYCYNRAILGNSKDHKQLISEINNNQYIKEILKIVNCDIFNLASAIKNYKYKFILKKFNHNSRQSKEYIFTRRITGVYPSGSTKIH